MPTVELHPARAGDSPAPCSWSWRSLLTLYILYLLRKPLSWLIIAAFIAVAAAGPVNFLQRYMKRGFAIALVYLILILIPIGLGALLVPPLVGQVEDLAANAPEYVQDVEDYVAGQRDAATT